MEYRIERDTLGEIAVPADKYWGAQTERARRHFSIGPAASMPLEIIYGYAVLKKACAFANCDYGVIDEVKRDAIARVCDQIERGDFDEHFPLVIWQSGSGTQTNMNINEVIANRATALLNTQASDITVHPNDDVNASQSSNDTFPSVMHIVAYQTILMRLLPALSNLQQHLIDKASLFNDVIKVGRTHLMDAAPLSLGQEFSAFAAQIAMGVGSLSRSLLALAEIAIGGTAVGTGLNSPAGFDQKVCDYLNVFMKLPFKPVVNKFAAQASHEVLVAAHSAIKQCALSLNKIAGDIRLLASGPRTGFDELHLPANEPGSSIMPGKVNPTQCEALMMVCAQVQGNDAAIIFAQVQSQLQLNTFKPLIISNFLQSAHLLADAVKSFDDYCIQGLEANSLRIAALLDNNLMLATALNPHIGYQSAAEISLRAHREGISLRQAAIESGYVTEEQFSAWVNPSNMIKPYEILVAQSVQTEPEAAESLSSTECDIDDNTDGGDNTLTAPEDSESDGKVE